MSEEMQLQNDIVNHLKTHRATAEWFKRFDDGYTMDVPMVVQAMIDREREVKNLVQSDVRLSCLYEVLEVHGKTSIADLTKWLLAEIKKYEV